MENIEFLTGIGDENSFFSIFKSSCIFANEENRNKSFASSGSKCYDGVIGHCPFQQLQL